MANTVIQLKYSDITSVPASLATGEVAYSNSSSKLFIGLSDGSVVNVGGVYYTDIVDAASSADSSSTLVKRDADGNFTANVITASEIIANITGTITGVAASANKWETARDLGLAGDATGNVTIDGTENETLTVTLADTGVGAGTYGGSSNVGVFTVDSKGRITSASNVAISSTLSITDGANNDDVSLIDNTLTFSGSDGVTATVSDNQVSFNVDNTVVRTTGSQTVEDLTISGNLIVQGVTTQVDSTTVKIADNIITINAAVDQASAPVLNAGIEVDRGSSANVELLWNETSDKWTFTNNGSDYFPIADGDRLDSAFGAANTAQTTADAAFGAANTAQTTADAAFGAANTAQSTADAAFGAANTAQSTADAAFAAANSAATTDYTTVSITAGDYGSASIIPVLHLEANGRVSSVTNTTVAIATSAVTSGTFGVARGGTGASTFSTNGVIISGATGTTALSALTSATEGHVLQINASGVPTFDHLNGGSF
jgi:hypothetical protein